MIAKLSLKNIKKSIKDYAIYFFTLVLGIAIFYIFNSIDSQTVMLNINSRKEDIISLLTRLLSATSVFVSFILGSLIIYASRFLIKRRNKEFGVYLTLGMSKRKISFILFLETLLIGFISLGAGLILGVFASQLMSILVAKMFDADMSKFQFVFSFSALIKTCIYFGIMYFIVMIFNTIIISKCKLIDLLHSSAKSEKVKIKNPIVCIIIFILSAVALGYAYYMVTDGIMKMKDFKEIFKPIIIGIVSTFLIFWSISGLILKVAMSLKGLYYKGLNQFMIRQLSSKINTTVISMTVICLMLFLTICALSSSLSLRNSLNKNVAKFMPADIQVAAYQEEGMSVNILDRYKKNKFDYSSLVKEYVVTSSYRDMDFNTETSLGSELYASLTASGEIDDNTYVEEVMSISDYNKIANIYNREELRLNDDEYIIVSNFKTLTDVRNIALESGTEIKVFGKTLKPKYKKCIYGFVELSSGEINGGIFIVPDSVVAKEEPLYTMFTANYNEANRDKKYEIDDLFKKQSSNIGSAFYTTKTSLEDSSIGLGAIVTFLGIYLGIIFLMSSAAILALKNLSEASDNRKRYIILRKIGADESLIKKSLFREILIFFMFPLVLAIIHSIFGMRFALIILEMFGRDGLLNSVIVTSLIIVFIYGGYFLITYHCSKNIIKEK